MKDANHTEETWVPAPGLDGFYEVSDQGNIRRCRAGKNAKIRVNRKFSKSPNGYLSVQVHLDKRVVTVRVHRTVARAFLGEPPPGKYQVNHKNGVKTDNRAENLEWVSQSENMRHAQQVLGWRGRPGRRVYQIAINGSIVAKYDSAKNAADSLGWPQTSRNCISTVCSAFHRRTFRKVFHRDYIWVLEADYSPAIVMEALAHLKTHRNQSRRRNLCQES